jgi:hypothetical protein
MFALSVRLEKAALYLLGLRVGDDEAYELLPGGGARPPVREP